MNSGPADETLILVIPSARAFLFASTAAFAAAQGSRKSVNQYTGAAVIDRSGRLRKILQVTVQGLWGDTLGRKLLSALTSAWAVHVEFSAYSCPSVEHIRAMLLENLDPAVLNGRLKSPIEIRKAIESAASVDELFGLIGAPPPSESLDVL